MRPASASALRGPAPEDLIHLLLRVLSWTLIIVPGCLLALLSTNWLFLLLAGFALQALVETILARREMQRRAVWRIVADVMGRNLPPAEALRIHQLRFAGVVGRAYRGLVGALDQGVPWSTAIENHAAALPRMAPAYMRLAGDVLPRAEAELGDDDLYGGALAETWRQITQRITYFAGVSIVFLGIVAFLFFKILPSYQAIFADFSINLPTVTHWLEQVAQIFAWVGIPLGIAVSWAIAGAIVVSGFYIFDKPVLRIATDRLLAGQHRAAILRMLAIAAERRVPLGEVMSDLGASEHGYPSVHFRHKLSDAGADVAAGCDWPHALLRQRLINRADVDVLRAAQLAQNLPWALRALARQKLQKMVARFAMVENIVFSGFVLLMGLVVMLVCVGLLLPLAELIMSLA